MIDADQIKQLLGLVPLTGEGGFFIETYRSNVAIPGHVLPPSYGAARQLATAIYYLLTPDTFSAMHRIKGDEIFHFYLGEPVEMLLLYADGSGGITTIGNDLAAGHRPLVVVPGGTWQGSMLKAGGSFALMGTTMAPGFEFADFELASRQDLLAQYPKCSDRIIKLTYGAPSVKKGGNS
jgi:predicted cupin superfamily sugar epimerase